MTEPDTDKTDVEDLSTPPTYSQGPTPDSSPVQIPKRRPRGGRGHGRGRRQS